MSVQIETMFEILGEDAEEKFRSGKLSRIQYENRLEEIREWRKRSLSASEYDYEAQEDEDYETDLQRERKDQ